MGQVQGGEPRQLTDISGAKANVDLEIPTIRKRMEISEGNRSQVYDDKTGNPIVPGDKIVGDPTIGIGHKLTESELKKWQEGEIFQGDIGDDEINFIFDKDFNEHSEGADKMPGFSRANAVRKGAIMELRFNMGKAFHEGFPAFTKAMEDGRYDDAANELKYVDGTNKGKLSQWYRDVKERRAEEIISLIRTGNNPT